MYSIFDGPVIKFLIGKDRHEMSVHAILLASQSPALDRLINGPMKEAKEKLVVWEDVEEDTFRRFCEYLYYDRYTAPGPVWDHRKASEDDSESDEGEAASAPSQSEPPTAPKPSAQVQDPVISKDILESIPDESQDSTTTKQNENEVGGECDCIKRRQHMEDALASEGANNLYLPPTKIIKDLRADEKGLIRGLNGILLGKAHGKNGNIPSFITKFSINEQGEVLNSHQVTVVSLYEQPQGFSLLSSQPRNVYSRRDFKSLKNPFTTDWMDSRITAQAHGIPSHEYHDYSGVLLCHAQMYALGEKYDIGSLKAYAWESLYQKLLWFDSSSPMRYGDIASLISYVYQNTPTNITMDGMRELVLRYLTSSRGKPILVSPELRLLLAKGGDLTVDLVGMTAEAMDD